MSENHWITHDISRAVELRIAREMPALSQALDAQVSALWNAAQVRSHGRLFNGRVFSADSIAPDRIEGHWTEFRRVIARMERPELGAALQVRPLAAGGVIVGGAAEAPFVVFGQRPAGAVYQAGEWQLPPAGSIDPTAVRADGHPDPVAQLLGELDEELGMPADSVSAPRPLCIVEHPGSGVLDLGIAVRTHWTEEQILASHAAHGNGEYAPLRLIPVAGLAAFMAEHVGQVTRQALFFLTRAGLL